MTVFRSTRTLLVGAAVAALGVTMAIALPATAATSHPSTTPVTAGSYYLALGDSVAFGYREANSAPSAPDYTNASNFTGYPELVGSALGLNTVNAACPGETSGSFVNVKNQSNGCEANSSGVAAYGYRTNYPLHEKYTGSQLAFATNFLRAHLKTTKLVTLQIGANDGFICQASTADHCTSPSEIEAVVAKIEKNVTTIMNAIRNKVHYTGQIVIVNYYSTDYTDTTAGQTTQLGTQAINNGLDSAAYPAGSGNKYNVQIASTYKDFKTATAQTNGDDCTAGVLTMLTGDAAGTCGVHPSYAGQNIIANATIRAIKK